MIEAKEGCALLEDVDEDTFVRFSQYAYMGDYIAAEPETLLSPSTIGYTESDTPIPRLIDSTPMEAGDVAADAVADVVPHASVEEVVYTETSPPTPPSEPFSMFGTSARRNRKSKGHKIFKQDISFEAVESTTRSKKSELWTAFRNKTYPNFVSTFRPRKNRESCEDYTEVFLCHARLYVFAEKYDIEPLRNLCLHKLQDTLVKFTLYEERVGDIVELMRYAYSNTADRSGSMDGLRSLLAHYAACVIEDLAQSDKFELLFEEFGSLARDLVHYLLKRLD